jgi:hypothetical protein
LLWPGALGGLGLAFFSVGVTTLLAANRLRACFAIQLVTAGLTVPMIGAAWTGGGLLTYAWAMACGQLLAGVVSLILASPLLTRGWVRDILLPPITCGVLAMVVVLGFEHHVNSLAPLARLCLTSAAYLLAVGLMLRLLFPATLTALLSRLPGGTYVQGWLHLLTPKAELS